ncbi:beta strand repeat-containing protein [Arsenicibacter rosenii]|uniref:Right handed beta helix domain-containing protein n=1 Tax=Arsenicibacter rosenii TaxID=1750698 RepID=A0A1S2VEF0_9BACT|nr:choice-of-anchor Q domain-containing protein [Arsenicibacter rosenii]OIN56655.1 hypothetical protein BLX24_23795 [Arsenicibacter rosenii]
MSIITNSTGYRRADRALLCRIGWLTLLFWGFYQSGYGQTIIQVTNTGDSGPGTLRQALADVDGSSVPGTFTITFTVSGTIALTSPLVAPADKDVTITGPSATTTAITLSGGGPSSDFSILDVPVAATLTVRYLSFANGHTSGNGGAISLGGGTLRLAYGYFHENQAGNFGGAIYQGGGSFTITNSTFAGNTAISNSGAIHKGSSDDGLIDNCTFSSNVARAGGAIEASFGSLTISNSTFTQNQAVGVTNSPGDADGGAIYGGNGDARVTINNCLIAGNTSSGGGQDIRSGFNSSTGHNLIGNPAGATLDDVTTGNLTGMPASVVLSPVLATNGGATPTHALLTAGPAINAGPPASTDPDQRGLPVFDTRRDIGAFESQVTPLVTATGSVSAACNGAGGFSLTVTGGTSGYAYRLTDGGSFTALAGASPYTVSVTTAGSYTVTVQDGAGNLSVPMPLTLTGPPTINIAATPSLFIVSGQRTTLTASGAGSYQWSTGENTAAISVSVAGPYSVTGTTGSCWAVARVTVAVPACNTVVYVTQAGAGAQDGSSWSHAFSGTALQTAIQVAAACGAQVWVAQGLYKPTVYTGPESRTVSFFIPDGVQVYGGYAAGTNSRTTFPGSTTLSGDIDNDGLPGNNSYHVVRFLNAGNQTRLDGVVITGGNSNGSSSADAGLGGGVFNDGGYGGSSSPVLANVYFLENNAVDAGGAMYNNGFRGASSPTLINVSFTRNSARNGGAMYNYASENGVSNPVLTDVSFSSNSAAYGGGMYSNAYFGLCNPVLTNVHFSSNSAVESGGAIYNDINCSPIFTNCSFTNNSAFNGGAMRNYFNSNPSCTSCIFQNNTAAGSGGAMYNNSSSSPLLTHCVFRGNTAVDAGSAMINNASCSPILKDCIFEYNSVDLASISGGTVTTYSNSNAIITNCIFTSNSAPVGGAISSDNSGPVITNTVFTRNLAIKGGAIYILGNTDKPVLTNVSFSNNSAVTGGALSIVNYESVSLVLTNSVLFGNGSANAIEAVTSTGGGPSPVIAADATSLLIRFSLVEAGVNPAMYTAGPGNLTTSTSPFVSDSDLQLATGSVAINAGDIASLTAVNGPYSATALPATDLAGVPRIVGGRVDMGAYESQTASPPLPCGLPPAAISFRASGDIGPDNCSVPLLATATGDRFVMTGPSGYVYSTVYRNAGTYSVTGLNVRQPGVYTLTVYSGSCTATYTTEVAGTACR